MSTLERVEDYPNEWNFCRLSDFVKHKSGDSKIIKGKQSSIPGVGLIQGFSASGPDVWVTAAQNFGPGVVVSAVGARCGKTFIANGEWTAIANTHVLRPGPEVDNKFLWYLTNREEWWQKSGTAQPFVKVKDSLERPIALPPLKEQEKIVEFLEEQLSRLDAALVSVRLVRKEAARFRRSLLHVAFAGALTGQDLSEGQIPHGWRKSTISDVADVTGGRTPTKFEQRLMNSGSPNRSVPFYKVGDMNSSNRFLSESRVYFSESEASNFGIEILKAGTVIFPKAGGAIATNKKRILELPGAIDLNCMGVTANGELHEKLLYWFFESFNLSSIADGTVLPQISKKKVSALEIAYPIRSDEQLKLLDEIEAEISKSEAVVLVVDGVEKKASALRRSLLHAAFSGKLTKEWREGAHV